MKNIRFLLVFFLMITKLCAQNVWDPYKIMEAERCDEFHGVQVEQNMISCVDAGDWICFKNVEFKTTPKKIILNYARPLPDGMRLYFFIDDLNNNNNLIAEHIVEDTKGDSECIGDPCWEIFRTTEADVNYIFDDFNGINDLYIRFSGGFGVCNLDWIYFADGTSKDQPFKITYPKHGDQLYPPVTTITASGNLQNIEIGRVDFFVNNLKVGSEFEGPFEINWKKYVLGDYKIGIEIYSKNNDYISSDSVEISIVERTAIRPGLEAIEAESLDKQKGVGFNGTGPGPKTIQFLDNNDWAMYKNVDFGENGVNTFVINYSSISNENRYIKVVLDEMSKGTILGTFPVNKTGTTFNFFSTFEYSFDVSIHGVHDVYLLFSETYGIAGINWFKFSNKSTSASPKISDYELYPYMNVFPNPASGKNVSIDLQGVEGRTEICFYDMTGKKVFVKNVELLKNDSSCIFDISNLTNGVYFISVVNGKNTIWGKLIIK